MLRYDTIRWADACGMRLGSDVFDPSCMAIVWLLKRPETQRHGRVCMSIACMEDRIIEYMYDTTISIYDLPSMPYRGMHCV